MSLSRFPAVFPRKIVLTLITAGIRLEIVEETVSVLRGLRLVPESFLRSVDAAECSSVIHALQLVLGSLWK